IIFLSLIGFAFVPQLACHPILTAITFGVLSAGAVCITMVAFWNGFGFEGIWPGRWSTRITRTIDAWRGGADGPTWRRTSGLRSDRGLGPLAQLPRDLDRLDGQDELRGFEPDLVLRGADLAGDDIDRQVLA